MNIDFVFTGIGAICTVASIIGAWKSNKYYKKSRNLVLFSNCNVAYLEVQKIIDTFTQLLKLSNPKLPQRGTNIDKTLSKYGVDIKNSVNIIRKKLSIDDWEEIESILQGPTIDARKYIDSIITCSVIVDGKFVLNDDFNSVQEAFYKAQKHLKSRSEELAESIKS